MADGALSSGEDDFLPSSSSSRRFKQGRKSKTPTGSASRKRPKLISQSGPTQQPSRSIAATATKQQQHSPSAANSRSPEETTQETLGVARSLNIQLHPQLVGSYEPSLPEQHPPDCTATGDEDPEPTPQQLPAPADDACPICNVQLCSISDTGAGRAAHVNACLDVTAGGPAALDDGDHHTTFDHVDMTEPQDCEGQDDDEEQKDEPDSMQAWLSGIGAGEVADVFKDAEIDLSVLPHLNDNDLQEMGIADIELRTNILQAAAATTRQSGPQQGLGCTALQQQQEQEQGQVQEQHRQQQQDEGDMQTLPAGEAGNGDEWAAEWLYSQDCGEEQWDGAAEQWDGAEADGLQERHVSQQQQQQQQQEQGQWQLDGEGDWEVGQPLQGWHELQPQQQQDGWQNQHGWPGDLLDDVQQQETVSDVLSVRMREQPAQHIGPQQLQDGSLGRLHQQQGPGWPYAGEGLQQLQLQQQERRRGNQQQQRQQQQSTGPLRPLSSNQQQPPLELGSNSSSRGGQAVPSTVPQQSSITGFVTRQPRQQQGGVKEQWRALFKRPKQPLGAHNPAQQEQREARQARIGVQGQLVPAQQQPTPAAAAAMAPMPDLPRATGPNLPSWWPAWRRLPGSNIIVDCFGRSCGSVGNNRTWVLTHFHADHYMGLSKGFKQGRIICTPITAALVRLKLRVPQERLVVLPLGQELEVEGTRLQLIDANHCPGAAMVVAQPPGGAHPVLHTGDARLTAEATRDQPVLQALVGKAVLVLDTTYADPTYCFPPQRDILDWVLKAVKAELFNPRCLFVFGTYTIGKEKLFMHVAAALQRKVYVAAAKRSIMSCLDLPPNQAALLTTNHLDANIHAVPMRQVTLEAMESLLLRYKGRYTAVVGFKPTGWSHAGGSGRNGQAAAAAAPVAGPSRSSISIKPNRRRSQRGTVVLYQVPYSEHSSCAELCSFVEWFKPLRIIPSVNNDNGPKLRAMMAAVTASSSVAGPMDAFARQQPQQRQQQQHPPRQQQSQPRQRQQQQPHWQRQQQQQPQRHWQQPAQRQGQQPAQHQHQQQPWLQQQ